MRTFRTGGLTRLSSRIGMSGAACVAWCTRGGRASVGPVVLGSGELRELRALIDTAVYSTGTREVTLRHGEFKGALDLVDAMLAARRAA